MTANWNNVQDFLRKEKLDLMIEAPAGKSKKWSVTLDNMRSEDDRAVEFEAASLEAAIVGAMARYNDGINDDLEDDEDDLDDIE